MFRLLIVLATLSGSCCGVTAQHSQPTALQQLLDRNDDGTITAYETLDEILSRQTESGQPLITLTDLQASARERKAEQTAELQDFMQDLEADSNRRVSAAAFRDAVGTDADHNADGFVDESEARLAFSAINPLLTKQQIQRMSQGCFR